MLHSLSEAHPTFAVIGEAPSEKKTSSTIGGGVKSITNWLWHLILVILHSYQPLEL